MRHLTFTLISAILSRSIVALADPVQQTEHKYSLTFNSTYEQSLDAMRRAYADIQANPSDPNAMLAISDIYDHIGPEKRIQFNYDFFLQQPDIITKRAALAEINKCIESGVTVNVALSKNIADKIWSDLRATNQNGSATRVFAGTAVRTLLYLHDDRGLEAILTERHYIKTLQIVDSWNSQSNADVFTELSKKCDALDAKKPGAKERGAIYELCRQRKAAGAQKIEASESVIDLSKL